MKLTDPDLLDKMARIGGLSKPEQIANYKRLHTVPSDDEIQNLFTWHGAMKKYRERGCDQLPKLAMVSPIGVIYGPGGSHRYIAYTNGNVVFSRRHGTDQTAAAAKYAGFDVK